jgi:segregation and condensation protein A
LSDPTLIPPPDGRQAAVDATAPPRPGEVRLEAFQGPLEILLHLIRTEEIDVTTLPLAEIARQCNQALALTRDLEPGLAGDHVVGVATLIHLKSRRLLPPDPAAATDPAVSPEEQALFDRAERVQALRQVAEHLQEREAVMEMVYLRPRASIAEFAGEEEIDADLFTLLRAFREILRRVGTDERAHLSRERITLVERIDWLLTTMRRERQVQFKALFSGLVDRVACILTFLALLEIIRLRLVRAHTSHHLEDILIILADDPPVVQETDAEHV